jgi:hypothetical protein
MTTKKMAAILGVCLSFISGCSASIPVSNEQISKDIFSKKNAVLLKNKGSAESISATGISFFEGKAPNGEDYHHCFKVNSSDFTKEIGQVEITLFNTGPSGVGYQAYIQTAFGKVKLLYNKKGDEWVFKDLSLIDDATPFIIRDVLLEEMKLTVGVSKPLCDIFDSSKVKKQAK